MFSTIRVNTLTGVIFKEAFNPEYKMLGNRGLVAKIMTEEVDPACEPLGKDNKLIFCTGILAGTNLTTAHRLSVGGKSPLTGGIKEANSGGNFASMMAQHGIKSLILEDKPEDDKPQILLIDGKGECALLSAEEYSGVNNYTLVEKLHERFGDSIAVASIGTAGERLRTAATIQVTDFSTGHPSRSAARGGLGAVMGAKGIKAVVIQKPETRFSFSYADRDLYNRGNKKFISTFAADGPHQALPAVGTVGLLFDLTSSTAMLPVNNFSGKFCSPEEKQKVETGSWAARLMKNNGKAGIPCQSGCVIKCSNIVNDNEGNFVTSGLEYETYALSGPNCGIYDIDFIARFDQICDDYGVDTIETGCALGVLMDNGVIPWGDTLAAEKMLMQMLEDESELGITLGNGVVAIGQKIGAQRVPAVKGQAMAAYDPRSLKGVGVTYATSPMGADHTAGLTLMPGVDPLDKNGKVELSKENQYVMAAADNFMCSFAFTNGLADPSIFSDIIKGALNEDWDMHKIIGLGAYTVKLEHEWNLAAGLSKEDDCLPDFFYTEPNELNNQVYDITQQEFELVHS